MRHRARLGLVAVAAAAALAVGVLAYFPGGSETTAKSAEQSARGATAREIERLENLVAARPHDVETLGALGRAYEQRVRETGDLDLNAEAEAAYARALAADGTSYVAATGLASVAASRHEFRKALRLARRAVALEPRSGPAHGILGDALVELGRYRGGFAVFERMAALEPNLSSYARVAYARELLGRTGAALDALSAAIEAGSGSPEHLAWTVVQRGNLLFDTGRLGPAAAAYRTALGHVPGYLEARGGLARVAAARGRWDVAIPRLRSVVAAAPDPGHAAELGDVLQAAGRPGEAHRAWEEAALLEQRLLADGLPDEPEMILFAIDRGLDPVESLERARRIHSRAPSIQAEDVLAWALYATGDCPAARAHSERALRLGTRDALMLFHRGMIERCLGRESTGRAFLRRALDASPHFSLRHGPTARALVR